MKNSVLSAVILIIAAFLPFQSAMAQGEHIAIRTNDKFSATVTSSRSEATRASNSFIEEFELDVKWWGLLGQPVYSYGFKWVPSGKYRLPDGRSFSREELSEYPELQARFDDLRPSQIEVSFDVAMIARPTASLLDTPNPLSVPNYYAGGAANGIVTTSAFLTGKPNEMMTDFSPGSPKDWKSFVRLSGYTEDENKSAQNTFREAERIDFTNLRITKIILPDASAENILDALDRAEASKKSEDAAEETLKSESVSPNQDADIKTSGLWDDTAPTLQTVGTGSVWDDPVDNSAVAKVVTASGGLWDDDNNSSSVTKKKAGSQNSTANDYEIKDGPGDTQGVVALSGAILIPYGSYKILRFSDGLAKVEKNIEEEISVPACENASFRNFYIDIDLEEAGLIDNSGGWVLPPEKTATVVARSQSALVIRSCPRGGCSRSDDRAKERREAALWESCQDKADRLRDQLRGSSYIVK